MGAGCKQNTVDKGAFKSALNDYYKGQQDCLWASPQKLPAQADTSNDDQTRGYDALVDAGLLKRTSAEKKRFLVGSKQVNDYDLTDKGRSTWTADQTQPGYGNFYTVNYRYGIANLPDWATTTEMKTAYPKIVRDSSGALMGSATLIKGSNRWTVSDVTPSSGTQAGM
jgi:hypothetical protein